MPRKPRIDNVKQTKVYRQRKFFSKSNLNRTRRPCWFISRFQNIMRFRKNCIFAVLKLQKEELTNEQFTKKEFLPGVSGILRVMNEEDFVGRCIDSCIDALDELICVYNDSIDAGITTTKNRL